MRAHQSLHRAASISMCLMLVGCSATRSVAPSSSPAPGHAIPLPSVRSVLPATGGALRAADGARLVVPAGALATPVTGSLEALPAPAGNPTPSWPSHAVGLAWQVSLGGTEPTTPVMITLPYDPGLLPPNTKPAELFLAYRDPVSNAWVVVPSTVDATNHTLSAEATHLSEWAPFALDWNSWLGFIAQAATGDITNLYEAVATATASCTLNTDGFVVDNSASAGMVKGCITSVAGSQATIRLRNERAIPLQLYGDALGNLNGTILGAGETVPFTAGGENEPQPVIVAADLSPLGLGYQLTDVLLRLLPGSSVFTQVGDYGKVLQAIVTAQSEVWTAANIVSDAKSGHVTAAAEEAVRLLAGLSYIDAFVAAANLVGRQYGVPALASLTPARLSSVLTAVNLSVLDLTVLSFDVQYLFTGHSEVHVTWTTSPATPTDTTFTGGPVRLVGTSWTTAFRITWKEANPSGVTIRIYGVTKCLVGSLPSLGAQVPCITPKTVIPTSDLVLMASVPSATSTYQWTGFAGAGAPINDSKHVYYGILIAAANDAGRSPYVLVTSSLFCNGCVS